MSETNRIEIAISRFFEKLEKLWEGPGARAVIGYILVFSFIAALFTIELKRHGMLPDSLSGIVPQNHFYAVSFVFSLLLVIEVIGLVFSLVHSVADSVGKQFEILSLILLRQSFKEFIYFSEPISWEGVHTPVYHILSDAAGALLIFILLGFYYRMQQHRAIVSSERETKRFVIAKEFLAILLIVVFAAIGLFSLYEYIFFGKEIHFFGIFYTILIFSDILIVLISLRYCYNYSVLFRNSGFALTTVVIRLALTAPAYYNVAVGLSAALFALGLTFAYNRFSGFQKV